MVGGHRPTDRPRKRPDVTSQLHLFHQLSQDLSKGPAGAVSCCKPLIPLDQTLYSGLRMVWQRREVVDGQDAAFYALERGDWERTGVQGLG